jgi:uncharacterized membrane protein YdbT with pleckstrin-like domain
MKGERIIYSTSLHWMIFLYPACFLAAAGWSFLFTLGESSSSNASPIFYIMTILFLASLASSLFKYLTSEFVVTNKRALLKTGFISRSSLEVLLTKIESIQVDQSIDGRIFGYGTINIIGSGGTSNIFHKISSPIEFRKNVQEQIDC